MLRATIKPGARAEYLALYHMNRATEAELRQHLERVERRLAAF
ncbi:MAG TPA: hypothetical protein VHX12_01595 [Acidisoma sp.]|nr:hypothetical protein [Acidisoma sp.]